jgi:hypothetical protein
MDERNTRRQVPKKIQSASLILFRSPTKHARLFLCSHDASLVVHAISSRALQIALLKIRAKQITIHARQGAALHPTFAGQLGANRVLPHQCDAFGAKWAL